jgi:hypothetical protein
MVLSAAGFLASAVSLCSNGVAQTVPVVSDLPTVSRSLWCACLSNVCRRPPPRSRLPVWVADYRPQRVKAVQEEGLRSGGTLVLALIYGRQLVLVPQTEYCC